MCKNINVVKLSNPNQIFKEYKKAFNRKDGVSTILVEYGDYYVGIGTLSNEIPEDLELNVEYDVRLTLSISGYFTFIIIAVCGYVLIKYD